MKKVDICECNLVLGTDKVKNDLEKSGDYEIQVHGCLGHCGECFETPFILLDGEFISGDSSEKLMEEIKK